MADEPTDPSPPRPPGPPDRAPAAAAEAGDPADAEPRQRSRAAQDPLSVLADAARRSELLRAFRLVVGSEGAYWERHLRRDRTWYSDNFFRVLGIDPDAERADVNDLIHPDDRPAFDRLYAEAIQRIGPFVADLRYRHRDGGYRWARTQARVWPGRDGRPERLIGMVTDVHDERVAAAELREHRQRLEEKVEERTASLERALAEARAQRADAERAREEAERAREEAELAREEAERAAEAKSVFLAHMSHEIRTPLNGLLGLNELALRETGNEQQRRYLTLALQSGRGLLEMLNGVLDFSRLAAGVTPLRHEPFDLAEVLAGCMRQAMPQARVKGLGMMYDYLGPSRVLGDRQRLQQIASNLLTNATKYTVSGHIALVAEVRLADDGHCLARIEFSDTGPGMPPEVADRVFEPFVQGDESLARRHGGTGLGLSIARGMAESMGGALTLETAPGEGARFTLGLRLETQQGADEEAPPPPGHAWLAYSRQVPAQWLAMRLRRLGWTHEILDGVPGVLARVAESRRAPDLVVLAEAVLDGATSLAALRDALPHARIVLLVRPDWNQPHVEAAARLHQMQLAFMPLAPKALHVLLAPEAATATAPDSGYGALPGIGAAGADVLIAEDNPINQLIIVEMVSALGLQPRLAENGAEAVSACRAQAPALVLMDLQMPEVDGLEAARQLFALQREGRLPPFPIVALTAHATPQDRERCEQAGMQGFLTKPISLGLLRSELRRWVTM